MNTTDKLGPKDHAEAIAIFRAQVIAPLCVGELSRGDRADLLRELSRKGYRPPGAVEDRLYAEATIERWYYAWKAGNLAVLRNPCSGRAAAHLSPH